MIVSGTIPTSGEATITVDANMIFIDFRIWFNSQFSNIHSAGDAYTESGYAVEPYMNKETMNILRMSSRDFVKNQKFWGFVDYVDQRALPIA